mgnify:CR=1 FL=1
MLGSLGALATPSRTTVIWLTRRTLPAWYLSLDNSNTLDNLIKTWAKAYVGKDMNAFTVLIADPDTNHIYQPGVAAGEPCVHVAQCGGFAGLLVAGVGADAFRFGDGFVDAGCVAPHNQ